MPRGHALPQGFDQKMVKRVGRSSRRAPGPRPARRPEDVAYRVIDPETFLAELEALFLEEYPEGHIVAEDDAFTRLGLLEPGDRPGRSSSWASTTARCWPTTTRGRRPSRSSGRSTRSARSNSIVVAHEYGHALQDAAWDLEAMRIAELDRSDAILAQQALIEGDATAVMFDWAARELDLADLLRVSATSR